MRLNFLSRQPDIVLDSPYFEPRTSVFEDPDESKGFDQVENGNGSAITGFQDVASPSGTQSSSLRIEQQDSVGMSLENLSRDAPSPSSGIIVNLASGLSEVVAVFLICFSYLILDSASSIEPLDFKQHLFHICLAMHLKMIKCSYRWHSRLTY